MIGRLRGRVLQISANVVVLDVHGVCYELEVTARTVASLAISNDEIELFTHLVVREDAQLLFGFHAVAERDLFRALIKINGVGPKLAVMLLSSLDPHEFARCIAERDLVTLTRVPGIGKKTAERLVVELKDRLETLPEPAAASRPERSEAAIEAENALVALGYRAGEAQRVIEQIYTNGGSTGDLIRAALKRIGGFDKVT
ncbi:MAG: Holliday junction branch migration protein RuvA [Gammaproteobacteria bacterium]|nr:Holliday junction branch migration protein RuvA [Gammaproteobacteria bacterium]